MLQSPPFHSTPSLSLPFSLSLSLSLPPSPPSSSTEKMLAYDDVDEETLRCYYEITLANLIFYALKEGACSEQSARMTAMEAASKNAGEAGSGLDGGTSVFIGKQDALFLCLMCMCKVHSLCLVRWVWHSRQSVSCLVLGCCRLK